MVPQPPGLGTTGHWMNTTADEHRHASERRSPKKPHWEPSRRRCFMSEGQAIPPFTLRWKPLLAAGALSGLVQVAAGVIMYLAGFYFDPRSALVSLVVLSLCIVIGTTWYGRTVSGGSMTYWRALFVGMVIGVCTGLVYGIYNICVHYARLSELPREHGPGADGKTRGGRNG